ncbi:hypothetical protein KVV02_000340 [Mortierella alpina]|uniref:Endonuclease/exonuclease/phosphatase domain-containing protein n=1 Tax=Mortierella alpina TaxID=64518 RepID=A0A9P8A5G9_MORAP|nr:hypothetical protein KVV02_000340 [Mortierella alpina]
MQNQSDIPLSSRLRAHRRLTQLLEQEPLVRPWERIVNHAAGHAFSIMTYNLLANSAANIYHKKYCAFTPDPCDWTSRRNLLLQEIEAYDMDIYCFQELDRDDFRTIFRPRMNDLGYDGLFQKRHERLEHGCAIFYRRIKVALVYRSHVFCDWIKTQQFAGILGIFDIDLGNEKRYVCIGTTHLCLAGGKNYIKLSHILALAAAAEALIKKNPTIPFLLCGDFNAMPGSLVVNFVTRGFADLSIATMRSFSKPYLWPRQRIITEEDRQEMVVFKKQTRHLRIRKAFSPLLPTKSDALRDIIRSCLDSKDGVIQHSLRLSSVYSHKDTVDFIFYGQPNGSKARMEAVARLRVSDALLKHGLGLPAGRFGSDHYAIGAQFRFVNRNTRDKNQRRLAAMSGAMSHTPLSQAFRLSPTAESVAPSTIIRIATRLDPRTAEHIVLWQDILDVFEHTKYLMNGETAVSFMVDDSFNRLLPLRIAYQSDVTLDVVVDSLPTQAQLPAYSDSMAAAGTGLMTRTLSSTTDDNQSVLSHHSSLCRHKDEEALAEEIQSLAILSAPDTQDESMDNGLTVLSANMTASIRLSLHSYTKRTQELVIKLDWDATLDDLRTFASAVAKANIISLTVDGWAFKGPALDVVNRSRRYDPILQLISNGRLQMMYLKSFEDFYQRISSTAARMAPHLRVLSIGSWLSASSSTSMAALSRIIECCPSLQELTLSCQSIPGVFGTIMERACRMQKLKTLTLASPGPTLKMRFSYGKDCAIEAEVSSLHALSPEEQEFLQKGHLTKLSVKHALKPTDPEAPLAWILDGNLHLSEVELVCAPERFPSLIELMTETRARLLRTRGAVSSCRLQLRNSVWDSLEQKNRLGVDGAVDRVSMVVTYAEAETPADIKTDLVMGFTLPEIGCDMTSLLMLYGWSIERLTTNRMFNDTHAALLEDSTAALGCKLVDVLMDPTSLGPAGVSSVNRILGRAENLKRFILHFGGLEDMMQQKKAVKLLREHGTRMTGLSLIVGSERSWLKSVEELFSSRERENWRRLNTLRVIGRKNDIEIPEACAQWITEVISRPNHGEEAALGSEVPMIQELVLERVRFREQDWRRILQSVDITFMRTLSLANTNFGRAEFELLCERNAPKKEGGDVLLESLKLAGTDIALAVDFLGETAFKSLKARFEKETRAVVMH